MGYSQLFPRRGSEDSSPLIQPNIFIFLAVILSCPTPSVSQTSFFSGGSVAIKHLSVDEGLSRRFVTCITEVSSGFIWIGTDSGVNRYNGDKFISIGRG